MKTPVEALGQEAPETKGAFFPHERSFLRYLKKVGAHVSTVGEGDGFCFSTERGLSFILAEPNGRLWWCGEARQAWNAYRDDSRRWAGCNQDARARLVSAVAERDGWDCFYCGSSLYRGTATLEHLLSISAGGTYHLSNLALACSICNAKAADLPLVEKARLREALRMEVAAHA